MDDYQSQKILDHVNDFIQKAFCVSGGLFAFYLSKEHIDRTRYESMKVRERLNKVTQEEYTPVRNFNQPDITGKLKRE